MTDLALRSPNRAFHDALQAAIDLEEAQKAHRQAMQYAVLEGQREGLTIRQIASLIDVSHQRVHQIIDSIRQLQCECGDWYPGDVYFGPVAYMLTDNWRSKGGRLCCPVCWESHS